MKRLIVLTSFFLFVCIARFGFAFSGEDLWQPDAQPVVEQGVDFYQEAATAEAGKPNQWYVGGALGVTTMDFDFFFIHERTTLLESNLHVGYLVPFGRSDTPLFISPRLQATYLYHPDNSRGAAAGDALLALGKYWTPEFSTDIKVGARIFERGDAEPLFGVGAGCAVTDNVRVTADYYKFADVFLDINTFLLGLQYYFDA